MNKLLEIFNVALIRKRMKHPPKRWEMYQFANGVPGLLTQEQLKEVEAIIDAEVAKLKKRLKQQYW